MLGWPHYLVPYYFLVLGMEPMTLCTAGSTSPSSYTPGVYPMPLCFGTMESQDKGNTWQSHLLSQCSEKMRQEQGREEDEEGKGGGEGARGWGSLFLFEL